MSITLTVVGCSGSVSGPDSPASSYLIQAPGAGKTFSLLLDCGPGSFGALHRYLDPSELDAVGLSHLHPDHCLDLTGLYVAARYSPTAPWSPVDLYGPPDTLLRLARAYDPAPISPGVTSAGVTSGAASEVEVADDLAQVFDTHEWSPVQQIGPFDVRTAEVAHPVRCFATRIDSGGSSMVFSGDTGPSEALVELARGVDLLLCEAAFCEPAAGAEPNPDDVHLTGAQAGEIARRAGVGRLVLTHIPPWHDPVAVRAEAAATFTGPIELAAPGARFVLER